MQDGPVISDERSLRAAARTALLIGIWVGGPLFALRQFILYHQHHGIGIDCHAYWLTAHQSLYNAAPLTRDAYLYSPAFAQVIRPIAELPFGWFYAIFLAIDVASVAWLLAPLGWRWAIPMVMLSSHEFVLGQIIGLLTVCAVLGITGNGGFWAFGWLTKIAPGIIGFTWLGVGRDWRKLGQGVAWTAGITAVSFVIWPSAWVDWVHFLFGSAGGGSQYASVRLVLAIGMTAVAARRHWWWALPFLLILGIPVWGLQSITYLYSLPRLHVATVTPEAS